MNSKRKAIIISTVTAVVLLGLFAVASVIIPILQGPGVKTGELDASKAKPATTELDGTWKVIRGDAPNISSVGFTFNETLPSDKRTTSGSTRGVRGSITIESEKLTSGTVEVDMTSISTDTERRDINVRTKIFNTDAYPISSFTVTSPVDLSKVPGNGSPDVVKVSGDLTIKGKTKAVASDFTIVRDADKISLSSTVPINRLDFDVETPEFVAAKIAEEGELNILLTFVRQ
ncbi:MAG: YceI family protein [Corynebacterium sp.]|uniref:YceI family protein n=1 Tax=Corynebacterium sp. TaxID=1720 RepID=UPI0026DC1666|nr:YceI family protein [Corynebacterium sp.]MDO4761725.1 YceI family protein [Corynebacterium sp.]